MASDGSVTELRVHGVSGTPPEIVLDRPLLRRVAGDSGAGFWRPREEHGGARGPADVTLEAYSWGNLTSGAAARALWLLLLPFMLANVAPWMRPARSEPASPRPLRLADTAVQGLSRLFALTLTGTFVLATAGVTLDLVAWQCTTPRWLCGAVPGRRLALLALPAMAVIGLLWYLGRLTWQRYEGYPSVDDGTGEGLRDRTFWDGRARVGRLRSVHVAAAFATLDAVLLIPPMRRDRAVDAGWLEVAGTALAVATGAVLVVAVTAVWLRPVCRRAAPDRRGDRVAPALAGWRAVTLLLTALVLVYASAPARTGWRSAGTLPGYSGTVTLLFTAQLGILALLGLAVLPLRSAARAAGRRPALGGFATPAVGTLALFVAAAFSAGVSYRVAGLLGGGVVPPAYQWAAFGSFVVVVLLVVVGAAAWFGVLPRLRRAARATTDADFPDGRLADPGRAASIDAAVAQARLTDHARWLFAAAFLPALAGAVVATVAVVGYGRGPAELVRAGTRPAALLSAATHAGTVLIGLAALALVGLGLRAYWVAPVRRIVGVLWDLGTFWPRATHPLAPPCYAERAVPELVRRTDWLAIPPGRVVLSGHSQGSVLLAAAVLQLPERVRNRTALLTYGSPLSRLYGRFFPAYLDADELARLATLEPQWLNLWRVTDPIGGPAGIANVDRRIRDPWQFQAVPGDTVDPLLARHNDYVLDPAYGPVVAELVSRLGPGPGDAGAGTTTPPTPAPPA